MKTVTSVSIVVLSVAAFVTLLATGQGTQGTPLYVLTDVPYDPNTAPFPYDQTKVVGELLGTVTQRAGKENGISGSYYDPDGDPVNVSLTNPPATMLFKQDLTTGSYVITWNPTVAGIYYVYLTAQDTPPTGTSLQTNGTIVWRVLPQNTAPVFKAIGNLYTH